MQKNRYMTGAFLTLAGGICWGLSGSMGQFLFSTEGMDSRWLVPIRLGAAGIIMLVISLFRYGKKTFAPWKERRDRIDLLIYGLAGVSLCQFFYFTTIQYSTAAAGTILQDLSPVMILLVSCVKNHKAPTGRQMLAILLALGGVYLLTTHGKGQLSISSFALFTGVLSAVCVTVYNVEPERLLSRYPVFLLQGWAFTLGSIMFTLLFRPWTFQYVPNAVGIFGIAFVVIVGNVLAFTSYMQGVAMIGPEKAILYGFSEPASAALISFLFLHTPFTIWDLIGFACIFAMLMLISKKSS